MLVIVMLGWAAATEVGVSVGALFWQGGARLEPAAQGSLRVSGVVSPFFGLTGEVGVSGNSFLADHHRLDVVQVRTSGLAELVLRRQRVSVRLGVGPYVAVRPTTFVAEGTAYPVVVVAGGGRARGALVVPIGDDRSGLRFTAHVSPWVGARVDLDAGVGFGWEF